MSSSFKKEAKLLIRDVIIVILIVLAVRTFVFEPTTIYNISMEPTVYEGHKIFIVKLHYFFTSPQRGDIVVLNKGKYSSDHLLKRVVAVEGDSFKIVDNRVYLNGSTTPEYEPFIKEESYYGTHYEFLEGVVPEGMVFVLGDNRNHSDDSRRFGYVDVSDIRGEAKLRYWPLDKLKIFTNVN